MKYFKDTNGEIFAYELDGSQDHLIDNKIQITEEEAKIDAIEKQKKQHEIFLSSLDTYVKKRIVEYPSIYDYIDAVVKNDQTQLQEYIDKCNAVKLKYPKP
jgi:hypothetical protein